MLFSVVFVVNLTFMIKQKMILYNILGAIHKLSHNKLRRGYLKKMTKGDKVGYRLQIKLQIKEVCWSDQGSHNLSKPTELRFVLPCCFDTNFGNLDRIRHVQSRQDQTCSVQTGSDTIRASQIRHGKWPAEGGFSVTNLGNLDKIRHDQGFPNSSRKMAC